MPVVHNPRAEGRHLVILGAGTFGEEIADLASDAREGAFEVVAFVEGLDRTKCGRETNGVPVVWIEDAAELAASCLAICAVGSPKRGAFITHARELGFAFATLVHRTAHVSATVTLGAGSIVGPGAVVAAHTTIGEHVIVNRGALIGHHATIGDVVTISPGANIAGRTRIGARAYIGMGALVLDGTSVGERAVVGAGAVVTRDVQPRTQVLGVPARLVKEISE